MATSKELRLKAHEIEREAEKLVETMTVDNSAEVRAKVEAMDAQSISFRELADRADKIDARNAAMEAAVDPRRPSPGDETRATDAKAHEAAINSYLRFGAHNMPSDQREILAKLQVRTQSTTTGSEGGYLVPSQWAAEISRETVLSGPMTDPNLITVLDSSTGATFHLPYSDQTLKKAHKVGQNNAANATSVVFGDITSSVDTWTTDYINVPNELIEDDAFNLPGFLAAEAGEWFGRGLNADNTATLMAVDGIASANSITNSATYATANTGAVSITDFVKAETNLIVSQGYGVAQQATYILPTNVYQASRLLVDTTGRPLVQASWTAGEAPTINGYNFVVNPDLSTSTAAQTPAIVFAKLKDLTARYVGGVAFRRLVEINALSNQTTFIAYRRAGSFMTKKKTATVIRFK